MEQKSIHEAKRPWGELSVGRKVYKPSQLPYQDSRTLQAVT